jgi:hypothetical protein
MEGKRSPCRPLAALVHEDIEVVIIRIGLYVIFFFLFVARLLAVAWNVKCAELVLALADSLTWLRGTTA